MKKGSILILVLGLILILSHITVSFLANISTEVSHFDRINRRYDYQVYTDSILSIVISNLYLYMNHQMSFEECCKGVNKNIVTAYGAKSCAHISPLDGRIALTVENLGLIEQIFLQNGINPNCMSNIGEFLEKKSGKFSWLIEELLQTESVREFFINKDGFFNKNWRLFAENVTTENTCGINLAWASDDVLCALCTVEGWDVDQVKSCIDKKNFLQDTEEDFLQNLYLHGFTNHEFLRLKNDLSVFVVTIYDPMSYENCSHEFLVKFDPMSNYNGFPFKVVHLTNKI